MTTAAPLAILAASSLSLCSLPPKTQACLDDAAGKWRNAVAVCELEGKTADECGLDDLTERRRIEEEECLK